MFHRAAGRRPAREDGRRTPRTALALGLALFTTAGACGGEETVKEMACGDADAEEIGPNDALGMAPLMKLDEPIRGCVDAMVDQDHYVWKSPEHAAGGFISLTLANKGTETVGMTLFELESSAIITTLVSEPGEDMKAFLAAVPRRGYGVRVGHGTLAAFGGAYGYTLTTKWTDLADGHEPNDYPDKAKSIGTGKLIKARLFAGHESAAEPAIEAYDDWYAVKLRDGPVTVQVLDVPADLAVRVELRDEADNEYLCASGCLGQAGTPLETGAGMVKAGAYRLLVARHAIPEPPTAVKAAQAPAHFTNDYTFRIDQ